MENHHSFGESSRYSRAQAIADGVLIDLTRKFPGIQAHWRHPMAATYTAFEVLKSAARIESTPLAVVIEEVAYLALVAAQARAARRDMVIFTVPIGNRNYDFKLTIGYGDNDDVVLTLMLPDEE